MRCGTRWCGGQSVVAAMARAARNTPKSDADETADVSHDTSAASPRFLISALQTFAQRPQSHTNESTLPSPSTFSYFIERAHVASASSLEQFQHLLKRNSRRGVSAKDREEDQLAQAKHSFAHRESVDIVAPQHDDLPANATSLNQLPSHSKSADPSREELAAAVRAYNPTLNVPLLQRIASRLAIADTLRVAKQLVRYLYEAAAAEDSSNSNSKFLEAGFGEETSVTTARTVELLRHAMDVCRLRQANFSQESMQSNTCTPNNLLWAFSTAAREGAGIAFRFHHTASSLTAHGQRRRRPLAHCFLRYVSDVQVSEVLPSGAVVVFTQRTHPAEVGDRAVALQVHGEKDDATTSDPKRGKKRSRKTLTSFRESLEVCLAASPAEVHMHCVLYRRGVPMEAALASLIDAAEGRIQQDDVHVNLTVPENDEHVVVQLCSVRVAIPAVLRGTRDAEKEEAVQYCLHVARALAHVNLAGDEQEGEEFESNVGLQLLYCRPHSCVVEVRDLAIEPVGAVPQLQYAFLLRGFDQRGGPADQLDRKALLYSETIPNFFSPGHFGPATVPLFRTYHVTAALERGWYAEAAAMMLCLACGAKTPPALPPWLEQALHYLCSGEEREGVWQAWWMQRVPAAEQTRLLSAKAELMWNVLASCRLQELATATGGRGDALMAASPEAGDFVRSSSAATTKGGEMDGFSVARDSVLPQTKAVTPICTPSEAARYTVHDIVLPIVNDAAHHTMGCESVAEVEAQLGFSAARRLRRRVHQQLTLSFRPLFVRATGFPRAARPWVRSFPEPSSGAALDSAPTVFTLATDWELAGSSGRNQRNYAAKSRGPRSQVWPLSKRGRELSDRLPVGLLAVASANGSSLLDNAAATSRRHTSRCLAVHCTLSADVSLGNYLCEFVAIEDLRKTP